MEYRGGTRSGHGGPPVVAALAAAGWVTFAAVAHVAGPLAAWLAGAGWARVHGGFFAAAVALIFGGPAAVYTPTPPVGLTWVLMAVGVAPPLAGGAVWVETVRARRGANPARWAAGHDEARLAAPGDPRRRPGRLVAGWGRRGRLLAAEPGASAVAFGPTGSGKTFYLVVPNALEWAGPCVVTTTKGPDAATLISRRAELGPVWVLAPAGAHGVGQTAQWSPVSHASDEACAGRMARWMVDASSMADDPKGRPWALQARKYIAPLLLAAHHTGAGMGQVVDWINQAADVQPTVTGILARVGFTGAVRDYASTFALHDEGIGSVLFTAGGIADTYSDPRVVATATRSDFTADELIEAGGTLVIVTPPTETDALAPYFTPLVASIIHAAEGRYDRTGAALDPPLGLLLDEAGNTFKYPNLPGLVTTGRAMGITTLTIWHDLAQLETRYGAQAARTILSQSKLRMLLPGTGDRTTLEYFSTMLGQTIVHRAGRTRDRGGGIHSENISPQSEQLAPLHTLAQMRRGHAVIQYDNAAPMRLRLRNFFTDRRLQQLAHRTSSRASGGPSRAGEEHPTEDLPPVGAGPRWPDSDTKGHQ